MSVSCEDDSRLPIPKRLSRIMDPSYPLCREDIVWVLHYVQKKVARKDPALLDLSKPRLLQNFSSYCEAALLLLGSGGYCHTRSDDLRACLLEAMHGLVDGQRSLPGCATAIPPEASPEIREQNRIIPSS
ncbi:MULTISPECIES: hypothetical protein [Paenibacillus]|uniref:hypothetical protein n=1 Tax=Paenibacillus TaxID=44249 RepID=UPI001FCFDBE9|nr:MULTISPECIES: hypothetical protein [Paenibacillus]